MLFLVVQCFVAACALLWPMGQNVQFYCERFGTDLHDAVTLAKGKKLDNKEMVWRGYVIKVITVPVMNIKH